ncbi:putative bestrophin, RFP-TM, chloride channel [Lyophyllum shimeji]|uniref:Bestrophin, RFP-TM, chloride channel n=1 Tax=Lyophyllum shimeji TaxID=47721 RepID=A0A9P3PFZ7_LYOSH|nr:putative bestrophin, RFP-TM, chloride channel [Lyophyllum shimeji]
MNRISCAPKQSNTCRSNTSSWENDDLCFSVGLFSFKMPGTIGTGLMKGSLTSVLPVKAPKIIKREHLRKYTWLPDVIRIKGSIIPKITGPVLTVTIFASGVAYMKQLGYPMLQTSSIFPILSVVVGLVLVFRNGTSYDRWWEGRKTFSQLTANIRNLSRQIWVNVARPPGGDDNPLDGARGMQPSMGVTAKQLRRRKIEAVKLCVGFAYAVKHYLRGEDGVHYDDYRGLLPPAFARYDESGFHMGRNESTASGSYSATDSADPDRASGSGRTTPEGPKPNASKRVRPKRSKQQMPGAATPLLSDNHRTVEFHPYNDEASLPLPLAIANELQRILFNFRKEGFLETVGPAGTNAMVLLISSMVDQLSAMERIANTPIPVSYRIHLKQSVTLYLFALPFTLVGDLGWGTVPIVTAVTFMFMGIEGIADRVEMPFGTDDQDLPTDRYCHDLREEINYIIERMPEGGEGLYGYDNGMGDD